jgi:hypothetical protein
MRQRVRWAPGDSPSAALDGVQAGALEVIADAHTAEAKADLARDPAKVYGLELGLAAH